MPCMCQAHCETWGVKGEVRHRPCPQGEHRPALVEIQRKDKLFILMVTPGDSRIS